MRARATAAKRPRKIPPNPPPAGAAPAPPRRVLCATFRAEGVRAGENGGAALGERLAHLLAKAAPAYDLEPVSVRVFLEIVPLDDAPGGDVPWECRFRRLIKAALRDFPAGRGLRLVDCRPVGWEFVQGGT